MGKRSDIPTAGGGARETPRPKKAVVKKIKAVKSGALTRQPDAAKPALEKPVIVAPAVSPPAHNTGAYEKKIIDGTARR